MNYTEPLIYGFKNNLQNAFEKRLQVYEKRDNWYMREGISGTREEVFDIDSWDGKVWMHHEEEREELTSFTLRLQH